MKKLVFSDVHLDEDSAQVVLENVFPGIREAAKEHGIKDIIMLGDLWHVRYKVDIRIQNALKDELLKWDKAGLYLRILPGNHDQVDVNGRNALEVFNQMRRVDVYSSPIWDADGLWIPYRKRIEDVIDLIENLGANSMNIEGKKTLFAHAPVQGALMNDHMKSGDGLPITALKQFDRVLLGHFHKRQQWRYGKTKVWYVGSVREVSANEAGEAKGFALWDGDKLEYVTKQWGPRHHKVYLQKGEAIDWSGFHPGDDVRVTTGPGVDVEDVGKILSRAGVRHTVTPEVKVAEQRLQVESDASLLQYAKAYVKELAPEDLSQARLMQTFVSLTGVSK